MECKCWRVVMVELSETKGFAEGSLACGQAYRGAVPPLPPKIVKTTSATSADVKGGYGGKGPEGPAPPITAQRNSFLD